MEPDPISPYLRRLERKIKARFARKWNPTPFLGSAVGLDLADANACTQRRRPRLEEKCTLTPVSPWEGRYKSCPVESDEHLLRCYRYIELNPVRAAMVSDPADHKHSSYRANALGEPDLLLTPHAQYLALGATPGLRQQAYRAFVGQAVSEDELELIRQRVQRQHALGSARFRLMIEAQLARAAGPQKVGRPRKGPSSVARG